MQVTDELRVLVEAEVARAIENFNKLSDSVDDSEKKTLSLGEALDSLSKKSLIISGVLGGAGVAAVKFAGENEKLKLSLKNMLGSAEEASRVFEEWRQLGTSPGLNVDEVFSLGRAMVNMGKDTKYATSTIKMLGDIAAGTGVSFGDISSSFERARAMGNLTSRDLVSLQQKGIPIVKQLAKEMGVTEESIKELAANGKISFSDLERAFQSMTTPGGQFAGMMDEMSGTVLEKFSNAADDAKQALAKFGELLLPLATELLENVSALLQGISNMDNGTKRFILGMGGFIAISGPAISAIKGIGAALNLLAKNPAFLVIGGIVAAGGAIAGLINKQKHAYEDLNAEIQKTKERSTELIKTYAAGNDAKTLDEETTKKLIRLYPELSGEIKAYTTTVGEAEAAIKKLTDAEIENAARKQVDVLRKQLEQAEKAWDEYERQQRTVSWGFELYNDFPIRLPSFIENFAEGRTQDWLTLIDKFRKDAEEKAEDTRVAINTELAKIGKTLDSNLAIIDLPPVTLTPTIDVEDFVMPDTSNLKKTWQEWFGEIAKVDPSLFGSSGAKAAELYIENFERTLTAQSNIAEVLGQELDVAGILRSRQSDVHNALVELLSINPEEINRPFEMMDNSIQKLVMEYKKLGEEAGQKEFENTIQGLTNKINDLGKSQRQLAYEAELARLGLDAQSDSAIKLAQTMDKLSVESVLSELRNEQQSLGKDKYDLALETMYLAGATYEEMSAAWEMIQTIREASSAVDELSLSFEELLSYKISSGLLDIFPEMEKQAAQALGNITAQLSMMSFDVVIDGLNAVGKAFANPEKAVENLQEALAQMSLQILNQLPNMFLQAGLQLIAQGQWPLGLAFIAAAGTSAITAGFVDEKINPEKNKASANAHGNAFNENGIVPYAHGGFFTNQIVNTPTYFRFGGKLGVMGEAGPESIMPLRRMANGDLGVAAQGGGNNTSVIINNYTGADVQQEEHTDAYGNKDITITFGQMVNNHITSGKADGAMTRFGSRPVGV